jgi:hypothetical protein
MTDYRRIAAIFATHHAKPMGINSLTQNYIPELKIVPSNLTSVCKCFSNLFVNNSMTNFQR